MGSECLFFSQEKVQDYYLFSYETMTSRRRRTCGLWVIATGAVDMVKEDADAGLHFTASSYKVLFLKVCEQLHPVPPSSHFSLTELEYLK